MFCTPQIWATIFAEFYKIIYAKRTLFGKNLEMHKFSSIKIKSVCKNSINYYFLYSAVYVYYNVYIIIYL